MRTIVLIQTALTLSVFALAVQPSCAVPVSATVQPADNRAASESHSSRHLTPQERLKYQQAEGAYQNAEAALQAKDYVAAEAYCREMIAINPSGYVYRTLAEALAAQGRVQEALQVYQGYIMPSDSSGTVNLTDVRALLGYALLLNKTGNWREAVAVFESTRPNLPGGKELKSERQFDSRWPQPAALEAAIHIGLGLDASFNGDYHGTSDNSRAFQEYAKALQFVPNSDLTNYYYGYGWRNLNPQDRAKLGSMQQAKAALQKAVLLGKADVKKAAQKVLKELNKPA